MPLELVTPLPPGASSHTRLAKHGARLLVLREILDGTDCSWPDAAPGLVTLQEVGELQGKRHALFEWVPGVTLRDVVLELEKTGNPVPLGLVGRLVLDAARALAAVNPMRAHGGLSDASLHVGFDGRAWVLDWGAPRLGRFRPLGRVSFSGDVFALGGVVHSALTGFRGEYASAPPTLPPPSTSHSEATPALDDVVMRALSPQPDGRQHDVGAFADELEAVLGEQLFSELQVSDVVNSLFRERIKLLRSLGGLDAPGRSDSLEAILPIPTGTQPYAAPVTLPPEPKPLVPWDSAELAPLPPSEPTLPRVITAELMPADEARPVTRSVEGTALTADGLTSVVEMTTGVTVQALGPVQADEKTGVVELPLSDAPPTLPRQRRPSRGELIDEDTDPRARVVAPSESNEDATAVGDARPSEASEDATAVGDDVRRRAARAGDARPGEASEDATAVSDDLRRRPSRVSAGEAGPSESTAVGDDVRRPSSRVGAAADVVRAGDEAGPSESSEDATAVGDDVRKPAQPRPSRLGAEASDDGARGSRAGNGPRVKDEPGARPSRAQDRLRASDEADVNGERGPRREPARDTAPDSDPELVPRPSPRAQTTRARPYNASSPLLEQADDTAPRPRPVFATEGPRNTTEHERLRARGQERVHTPPADLAAVSILGDEPANLDEPTAVREKPKPRVRPPPPAFDSVQSLRPIEDDEEEVAAPPSFAEVPPVTAQTPTGGGGLRVVMIALAVVVVALAAAVVVKAQRAAVTPPPEVMFDDAGDEPAPDGLDAGEVVVAVEAREEDAGVGAVDAGEGEVDAGVPDALDAGAPDAGEKPSVKKPTKKPTKKPVKKKKKR